MCCQHPSTSILLATNLSITRILPSFGAREWQLGATKKAKVISSHKYFLGSFSPLQRLTDKAGR